MTPAQLDTASREELVAEIQRLCESNDAIFLGRILSIERLLTLAREVRECRAQR